jgi:ribosomal-protein-alanine N-acetyltransferase
MYLKTILEVTSEEIMKFYLKNKHFLKPFEPLRSDAFYTYDYQDDSKLFEEELYENKQSLKLFLVKRENPEVIIGILSFSQIVMNAFCSCYMGYSLSESYEGYGYMTEAVKKGLEIIFEKYELHRIEANVMPRNTRSIKLLEKLNFVPEGVSKHYLMINGRWEDHIHYVLLNE